MCGILKLVCSLAVTIPLCILSGCGPGSTSGASTGGVPVEGGWSGALSRSGKYAGALSFTLNGGVVSDLRTEVVALYEFGCSALQAWDGADAAVDEAGRFTASLGPFSFSEKPSSSSVLSTVLPAISTIPTTHTVTLKLSGTISGNSASGNVVVDAVGPQTTLTWRASKTGKQLDMKPLGAEYQLITVSPGGDMARVYTL